MEVSEATIATSPPLEGADVAADNVDDAVPGDNQTVPLDDDAEKDTDNIFSSDSENDDGEFDIVIGDIRANVPFAAMQKGVTASGTGIGGPTTAAGKLDVDKVSELDGGPIYDADIASMTEKPWRKPGADITDYFNYGFNELTWNQYCERQRKLRAHYGGDQTAANKKLFSDLPLTATVAATSSNVSGHQRAQQKLEAIAQARGTVKVTRLGPTGVEMTADVPASELTGGGNATTALSAVTSSAGPQRVSTVNLSNPPPPVDLSAIQLQAATGVDEDAPIAEPPTSMASMHQPPPGLPNMNLPPPMPMMSTAPPGFGGPPGAGPPGAGPTGAGPPGASYGSAGFGGPPPGYGAPPPFVKHEMEAASYSDTSDIDEPSGPPMHQHGRPPPSFGGRGGYGGGPPGGHYGQPPPSSDYRRGRGGYGAPASSYSSGGADRDRGRERSRSPIRRSSRRDDRDRGSKRTRESSRDRDDKRKSSSSKRRRDDSPDDRRSSRRRGGDKEKVKDERDSN